MAATLLEDTPVNLINRKSILLVEDQAITALAQKQVLENHGYDVIIAKNGPRALELVDSNREIDLVLMDIDLGRGMDGAETAKQILDNHYLPLIFLTGHTDPETVKKTEDIMSCGYVVKEQGEHVLIASIRMVITHFEERKERISQEREEAARESERKYKMLFQSSPLGIIYFDNGGRIIRLNPQAVENLGGVHEDFEGIHITDLFPGEQGEVYLERINQSLDTDDTLIYEDHVILPVGERCMKSRLTRVTGPDGEVTGVQIITVDITEREEAARESERALAEKETLLRELYHRTKNNMQVINALLDLQSDYFCDDNITAVLAETKQRIHAMSLVHQKLYEARDLSRINLREYIEDLASFLMACYNISEGRIALVMDLTELQVSLDAAVPCGLVLNELLSNALKHAFPNDRDGEIAITLCRAPNGNITLTVADNGAGMPAGFDPRKHGRLGLQNIFTLCEYQLEGTAVFDTDRGVTCRIEFNDELYKTRI